MGFFGSLLGTVGKIAFSGANLATGGALGTAVGAVKAILPKELSKPGGTTASAKPPLVPSTMGGIVAAARGAQPAPVSRPLPVSTAGFVGPSQASTIGDIYGAADKALGGWLPGGPVAPGGFTGGLGGTTLFKPSGGAALAGYGGSCRGMIGAMVASGQIPMTTQTYTDPKRTYAPPGYVKIRLPNGSEVAILREVAYCLGLRKRPSRNGGISGKELRTAERVQRFLTAHTVGRAARGARVRARAKRR